MSVSKWKSKKAKHYYPDAFDLLGKPTFIANVIGGMALWKSKTSRSLYVEHILRDEAVPHCVPKPHHDFFYSTIKVYVPPQKIKDVLSISGSISYDGLKKHLTGRCGGIGANIATLYLGSKVANGEYSISKVKKSGLYISHIKGEAMSYHEMEKEIRRMKTKNNKKYAKELKLPFYQLAFSKCAK